jgi:sigma-B regulation protein RsbQ
MYRCRRSILMTSKTVLSRNNVKIFGKGSQPMLFAHGFGCDQNMWRFVAPAFEENYQTILFDYVGAGKSDTRSYNAERYSTLSGYAQDIIELCKELDLQHVIFVGHSVSCMIGLLAAIERPALFDKIIMIGPSPSYINDHNYFGGFEREDIVSLLETMEKNYIGWSNFMAPKIMGNSDRPELAAELETSFCSTDPVIASQFAKATFFSDNRKDLVNLKTPSLILQCTDDIIAPVEVGKYLADNLQNSTLKMIQSSGHCPHLSEPEETISLIKEYLAHQ